MPTIEVEHGDLESLLGLELPKDLEELNEILAYVKGEANLAEGKELHIELKDSNRADLWSAEGIARALRGYLNLEKGLAEYAIVGGSGVKVQVDARLKPIRPYIACAVVKAVRLSDMAIRQIMHLQDKMDQTYGRNRRRTSIGLYDFDLVTPPLRYGVAKPEEVSFVPLDFTEELTLKEILVKHPKGMEYGQIISGHRVWPIFMDSKEKVLSFPPVINSADLGRVTAETENVLVEVTGTAYKTVLNTLANVTLALADRGGSIYSVEVHYPYGELSDVVTPDLKTEAMDIDVDYVRRVVGAELSPAEIRSLLEKSRYAVLEATESKVTVAVPCYRVDIMHPIDIVEDIAIAYDYNKMRPRWPQMLTIGGLSSEAMFRNLAREIMVGLGYQEILSFTLSNPDVLFSKMCLEPEKVVEIANPKIMSLSCLRSWLLPSLLECLSRNTHVEYPQRVFEVGYCVIHDGRRENRTRDLEKLACVTVHSGASFTEAKATLEALLANLGVQCELEETSHGSFIEGRVGKVIIGGRDAGLIGEVHPQVLQNWNLENPAAAFEINLDELRGRLDSIQRSPK